MKFRNLILLVCIISFFSACTRMISSDIGGELIPEIDGINTKDSVIDVTTHLFADEDTARILRSDNHMVGFINDPLFGTTTATTFFQVSLPFGNISENFARFRLGGMSKDSIVSADSAVLILGYGNVSGGDTTMPFGLDVHEISNSIAMNANTLYPVGPIRSPQFSFSNLLTSTGIDIRRLRDTAKTKWPSERTTNKIRIMMPGSFAQRFIMSFDTTNAYRSDSAFKTHFNGFAIAPQTSGNNNSLVKLRLDSTRLALYFKYKINNTVRDTVDYLSFATLFGQSSGASGNANYIQRNYAGSQAATYISNPALPLGTPDSLLHIQTAPGTFARITLPNIKALSNRIIHKAELICVQLPDDNRLAIEESQSPAPQRLFLGIYDSLNRRKRNIPNDFFVNQGNANIETFGGFLKMQSLGGYARVATYSFDISRYLQGIITRGDNQFDLRLYAVNRTDTLFIQAPFPSHSSAQVQQFPLNITNDHGDGRVRLAGGNHSNALFRMRLRIIFSRL